MGSPVSDRPLASFWDDHKEQIAEALSTGVDALAAVLLPAAEMVGLTQQTHEHSIHWNTSEGRTAFVFFVVPDSRDLKRVTEAFAQAKQTQSPFTGVFVHQWTDGDQNWDLFIITPDRAMRHGERIRGTNTVTGQGPELREDIYTLFGCDTGFPDPGRSGWVELLGGPIQGVIDRLKSLAAERSCTQEIDGRIVTWTDDRQQTAAIFFLLPEPGDIDACIEVYERIDASRCPVSFVFVECERERLYDIFRLSSRSYLEHHNQAKATLKPKGWKPGAKAPPGKILDNLLWVPRWASHLGCIKGCLRFLGKEVSDGWLFGGTGHAFVLNIAGQVCPSGPTDWDNRRFIELGRNIGYIVEGIEEYCPDRKRSLPEAQRLAWDYVRNCLAAGLPCYGWELRVPEFYVIYGYDEAGYYVSGPECDDGEGPVSWKELGTSEIGVVAVSSVQATEPADDVTVVREALLYALDLGHNRRRWTDGVGGLEGFGTWIKLLREGRAGHFGTRYNAAVWAESRKYAVEFFEEAGQRLGGGLRPLFDEAAVQYETVARNLKAVSDAYPFFTESKEEYVRVDERAETAAAQLQKARDAEARGLDLLAGIVERLQR